MHESWISLGTGMVYTFMNLILFVSVYLFSYTLTRLCHKARTQEQEQEKQKAQRYINDKKEFYDTLREHWSNGPGVVHPLPRLVEPSVTISDDGFSLLYDYCNYKMPYGTSSLMQKKSVQFEIMNALQLIARQSVKYSGVYPTKK